MTEPMDTGGEPQQKKTAFTPFQIKGAQGNLVGGQSNVGSGFLPCGLQMFAQQELVLEVIGQDGQVLSNGVVDAAVGERFLLRARSRPQKPLAMILWRLEPGDALSGFAAPGLQACTTNPLSIHWTAPGKKMVAVSAYAENEKYEAKVLFDVAPALAVPLPYADVEVRLDGVRSLQLEERYTAAHYKLTFDTYNRLEQLQKTILAANGPFTQDQDGEEIRRLAEAATAEMDQISTLILGPPSLREGMQVWIGAEVEVARDLGFTWDSGRTAVARNARESALGSTVRLSAAQTDALDIYCGIFVDRGDAGPLRLLCLHGRTPPIGQWNEGSTGFAFEEQGARLEATLSVRRVKPAGQLCIRIASVDGLNRPFREPQVEEGQRKLAAPLEGYVSGDGQGRIYTSRLPSGEWKANTQYVDLQAEAILPGNTAPLQTLVQALPALRWQVEEVPDLSLQHPNVHREAAAIIGAGNAGFAAPGQRVQWQISDGPRSNGLAVESPLTWTQEGDAAVGRTRVRLHCPDAAGDRFRVHAGLPAQHGFQGAVSTASTGVMTMWKRIFVDYLRMSGARELPVAQLHVPFGDARIELVVAGPRELPTREPLLKSNDVTLVEKGVLDYIDEVYQPSPGRLCLVAALSACTLPEAQEAEEPSRLKGRLRTGLRKVVHRDQDGFFSLACLEVDQVFAPEVNMCSLLLNGETFETLEMQILEIERTQTQTRFWLAGEDLAVAFDGAQSDGTIYQGNLGARRFFPTCWSLAPSNRRGDLEQLQGVQSRGGGYPMLSVAGVVFYVWADASVNIPSGVSPTVEQDGQRTFAGRTLCFTSDELYADEMMAARVIVHELTHAFGMPHKCGRYDRRTPRVATCAMNYPGHWMAGPNGDVERRPPLTRDEIFLCAQHLHALRRVKLERNAALGWNV